MLYVILNKKIILSRISIFLFTILLILVHSTIRQIDFTESNSFISLNGAIIFVNDLSNEIKKLDDTNNNRQRIGYHDDIIRTNKELINLDDSSFILFGLNQNSYFCYQIYHYENSILFNESLVITDIDYDSNSPYHIHCNSLNYCVVARIKTGKIIVRQINISYYNPEELVREYNYMGTFIQCDSFSEGKIFCIFGIINGNQRQILYDYIDFSIFTSTPLALCNNDCIKGSVSKYDADSNKKFLVCYQQNNRINCQYFDINNEIITKAENYENVYNYNSQCKAQNYLIILKIYNYSVFLKTTCYLDDKMSVPYSKIIFMSFNFKINIELKEFYLEKAINFFNDEKKFYDFYSESSMYYLKVYDFLPTNPIEIIYFSRNENELYDFSSNHGGQTMYIILDQNTKLRQNDTLIENNIQNNIIYIQENDIFTFGKTNYDKLTNYYCYKQKNLDDDENDYLSLISKIELKRCYESCKICDYNQESTSTHHYCTECNKDYYMLNETRDSNGYFNCYLKNSSEVSRAYFSNDIFYSCNESCNSCENEDNCLTCYNGYFFKVDNNNTLLYNEYCHKEVPVGYYFDFNANILNKNNYTILSVYKPCYDTCSSCKTSGSLEQNNCIECKGIFTKYEFKEGQCLINTTLCTDNRQFWKIENNNITCKDECNSSLISEGMNKGQCVPDCKNYLNPSIKSGDKDINYISLTCANNTYCIPYESCKLIGFTVSPDGLQCLGFCDDFEYDIFQYNNISEYVETLPVPTYIETHNMTMEEKLLDIIRRKKRIEVFKQEKNFEEVINSFGKEIISEYNDLFKTQNPNPKDLSYLITTTTYDNFTITIYPLDIEDFAYENLFLVKNLGFINFTKVYPDFLNYEVDNGRIILVCVMEYFSHNYSINDLNYFLYPFNELSNSSFRLLQEELPVIDNLFNETSNYEIQYPLYNYYNSSVEINKRNSEYLVDNMIKMNKDYPEVNIYNISDPFYNDLCFLFTSDVGTDMTLNDRRKEYYINYSLCEDNCTLMDVINKDTNPRAVCICELKSRIIFNQKLGKEYDIEPKSSLPIKSFLCFKQTFNIYIGTNPIFWIFMIILVYQIYFLIMYIKYQTNVIQNIFGIKDNKDQISRSNSIASSVYSKILLNENESSKNKDSGENEVSEKDEEKKSAPVNAYNNPPKKGELKQNSSTNNYNTNDKDLISKSESTFIKDNNTNINNINNINLNNYKNLEGSEITYSDIKNGFELIEVNNLVEPNTIMENNFLTSPLTIERIRKMKRIKKAMNPLKEEENKKYFQTLEDILYSNNNKHKFKNKKNKDIANQLGGDDIINKNLIDNLSEDENKPRFPKNKIDTNLTSEKYKTIGSDHIIYAQSSENNKKDILIKEENVLEIKIKKGKNNKNNDNIDNIFEKNRNTLAKSLGKKDIHNYLKNENQKKLRTEDELNKNAKIKKELKRIVKDKKIRPNSSMEKKQNRKYKKKSNEKKENNDINDDIINNLINMEKNTNNRINKESIKLNNKYSSKYKINANKKLIDDIDDSNGNLKNKISEHDYNEIIPQNKIPTLKLKKKEENNNIINKIESFDSNDNNKEIIYINKKKEEEEEISSGENKEGSKIIDSKRNMVQFQEETDIEGDKANKDLALEKLKLKRTQNLELLNDKAPVSSVVEFLETENKDIMIEDNYLLFFWKYFIKRELWFIVIRDRKKSLPYFVRYSSLGFCLTFMFLLNFFFFFESTVHGRYIDALEGENIDIVYYFKNEFVKTLYISIIGNIFKMIIIKLVLYMVFKIGKNVKRLMSRSAEKALTKDEVEMLRMKREEYFTWYKRCLILYFCVLMALTILIGYICICYGVVYKNSINAFLFGIVFNIICSFVFCAIISFLIVSLYKIGKIADSKCVVSAYIVLSTLY